MKSEKPLGIKAYGSIPHLIGSRAGVGDKRITQGQHDIVCVKKRNNDIVIAQEKLDGSCVAVAKIDNKIIPLMRAGYLAETSKYEQHRVFAGWVENNQAVFFGILNNGERIVGEWLYEAHGTLIKLKHEPFVAFDIMSGHARVNFEEFMDRVSNSFITPFVYNYGPSISVGRILEILDGESQHGQEKIEGLVFRVETNEEVNFLAKYVRHDYEAGKYMNLGLKNNYYMKG